MSADPVSIRIAVLDDDQLILRVFQSMMGQRGYHADFFANPDITFKEIISHLDRYQLVVMDINMPEGDGASFVKKIRVVDAVFPSCS